jgi:hypothetical protein
MTVEELKTRPEFVTLAPQQQAFTLAYCTNKADKLAAARMAYTVKNDQSAIAIADRNLRHPVIKALVNVFYNRTEETGSKVEALAIIWKQIQSCADSKMKLDYLKLYGDWMNFSTKPDAPLPQEPDYLAALAAVKGD